jgi:hypothetical protein
MALRPNILESPCTILDPAIRWFPADEAPLERSAALCASLQSSLKIQPQHVKEGEEK